MINWRRDERGAVAPFVAILMVVLVGLASFAVDLGYQRVAARDMQAVADLVAMDMARHLDGKSTADLLDPASVASWNAQVGASLARNSMNAVGDDLKVVTCQVSDTDLGASQVCATPGIYTPSDRSFVASGSSPATHVRVITRTRVDYFFPIFANDGWVTKTAYSEGGDGACIRVGSYVADANLNDGALGPLLDLLGTKVGLSAAQGASLADLDVSLLSLLNAEVDGVTLTQAADAGVSLAGFFDVLATDVLPQDKTAAIEALQFLETRVPGMTVAASDLVALATGDDSGVDADVNLFDIVGAAVVAASGENGLALDVPINLPLSQSGQPWAGFNASAFVIQRPQIGCGKRKNSSSNPVVESSQIGLRLTGGVKPFDSIPLSLVNEIVGGLTSALTCLLAVLGAECLEYEAYSEISLKVELKVAPARAQLTGVDCLGATRKVHFRLAGGKLAELSVTANVLIGVRAWKTKWKVIGGWQRTGDPSTNVLSVGGPIVIKTDNVDNPNWESHTIDIDDDDDYDLISKYGQSSLGIPTTFPSPDLTGFKVSLGALQGIGLGAVVNALVGPGKPVTNLLNGLLSAIDTSFLNELLLGLGVDVSGARVSALRTPSCGMPALRG